MCLSALMPLIRTRSHEQLFEDRVGDYDIPLVCAADGSIDVIQTGILNLVTVILDLANLDIC